MPWQLLADRLAKGTGRQGLLYFSFEDERLAGMTARANTCAITGASRSKPPAA